MEPDDLNRWLSEDDAIVPSSGFTASVMEAVRREASEQRAMPFPWKRALPGLVMAVLALVVTVWSSFQALNSAVIATSSNSALRSLVAVVTESATLWIIVATVMTVVLAATSMRWTRARL